jgi:hypothetical protein
MQDEIGIDNRVQRGAQPIVDTEPADLEDRL